MKKIILTIFFITNTLFLFSQILVIDQLYNSFSPRCYPSLNGNVLMQNNGFDAGEDGQTIIIEYDNDLNEVSEFNFDQTNYPIANIVHVLERDDSNDYLVGFSDYSSVEDRYYLYTASLSSTLDNLVVMDSTSLGSDGDISTIQGIEIEGVVYYYFTYINSILNYFVEIDASTGEIIKFDKNNLIEDGLPLILLQIRDVGETMTDRILTNQRDIIEIDKGDDSQIVSSSVCWFDTFNNFYRINKLNFEFTENNEYMVVAGETTKQDVSGDFFATGRILFDDLDSDCNRPDNLVVSEEVTYGAFINSLFKNKDTGEIWAVGSTSDPRTLTGLDQFPKDFPTKIIIDKFDKNGEHLFQVEYLSDAHISPWDAVTTSDGGLAIVGSNYDFEELLYYRGFIMKLTADGELLPTSTVNIIKADQLSVFPNPTSKNIQIKVPNGNNEYSFTILNNLGQTILIRNGVSSDTELTLDQCPKGLYYLHIVDQDGAIQIEKIIKQ